LLGLGGRQKSLGGVERKKNVKPLRKTTTALNEKGAASYFGKWDRRQDCKGGRVLESHGESHAAGKSRAIGELTGYGSSKSKTREIEMGKGKKRKGGGGCFDRVARKKRGKVHIGRGGISKEPEITPRRGKARRDSGPREKVHRSKGDVGRGRK